MTKNSTTNLPFDPAGNIFRWGPVPGKFLYVSTFAEVHFTHFRAVYGDNWPEMLALFKDSRHFWVTTMPEIQATGQRVFVKYMLPLESRQKLFAEWQGYVRDILELEKKIANANFATMSNAELGTLWNNLNNLYIKFWTVGCVPEVANYGSDKYLETRLRVYFKKDEDLASAMEVLTAPTRMSFYQAEEVTLATTSDVQKHQQQFFWLKNSYAGTQILPVEFFAERKKELSINLESEIKNKLADTAARKLALQKQFDLSPEIMNIAAAISYGIEWQDERKKHIFIILHYLDLLTREVANRFGYDFDELHNLWHHQISDIIAGKDLRAELKKRAVGFGVRFFHDCEELSPEDVTYFWNVYGTEKVTVGTTEVKGIVASKGSGAPVCGKIHILLDPNKAESFTDGEILVAPMTSPEYAFVMKKAAAIITDTGGLTSHAAIVSRELGIPCLVGAKVATTLFKDGDTVEVDASKGMAKIV